MKPTTGTVSAAKEDPGFFSRLGQKIKEFFLAVIHGSAATKVSCLVMGAGQAARGQYIKGAVYFLLEVLFVLYMVFFGGVYLGHLFSGDLGTVLGTETWNEELGIYEYAPGDNSFLILLYAVVSLIVLLLFIALWYMNVRCNIRNDKIRNVAAKKPPQSYLDAVARIPLGSGSAKLSSHAVSVQGGRVKLTLSGAEQESVLEIGSISLPLSEIEENVTRFGPLLVTSFRRTENGAELELWRDENIYAQEYLSFEIYLLTDGERVAAEYLRECGSVPTFKQDASQFVNKKFYVPLLTVPLIGLLVFTVMPLIFMILIAFTNYDYEHTPPGALFGWVGFANFAKIFSIGSGGMDFLLVFLRVLVWTFVWAIFATFTNYFFGMIIALMINKKGIRFKMLWRTLFVIAIAVPQFVTLLLMQKILDADGIFNVILGLTGNDKILWLGDSSHWAIIPRVTIIVVNMWIGVPYTMLITTGVLMNIPKDLFEAAKLDGANPVTLFARITLPYVLFVTGPYLIQQFIGNINNFNIIYLLTGGGPAVPNYHIAGKTDLLITWLYKLTIEQNDYNLGAVIGIYTFAASAIFSLLAYSHTSANKNEGDFQV